MVPAHGDWVGDRAGPGPPTGPLYRPILAGRRGEFEALRHLDAATAPLLSPVLVLPALDPATLELLRRLPAGLRPALDLTAVPDPRVLGAAHPGVPVLPVIGLAESDDRLVAHGATARAHLGRALVRVRADRSWTGPDPATAALERVSRLTHLVTEQLDLLVDAGDVCCPADVRVAEPRVRRVVDWSRRHRWNSATVGAGGMPPGLFRFPTDEPVRLPRWDRVLWQRLADLGVGYADHGVTPARPVEGPPDRLPTLRYTAEDAWWLYRWSRRGGRGDDRLADLCRTLVSASHWTAAGAGFSWGDQEILRRARRVTGAGSATTWLAWGTSHHLAQVLAELTGPTRPPRSVPPRPNSGPTLAGPEGGDQGRRGAIPRNRSARFPRHR